MTQPTLQSGLISTLNQLSENTHKVDALCSPLDPLPSSTQPLSKKYRARCALFSQITAHTLNKLINSQKILRILRAISPNYRASPPLKQVIQ